MDKVTSGIRRERCGSFWYDDLIWNVQIESVGAELIRILVVTHTSEEVTPSLDTETRSVNKLVQHKIWFTLNPVTELLSPDSNRHRYDPTNLIHWHALKLVRCELNRDAERSRRHQRYEYTKAQN
jgi:hypothetical protein